MKTDFGGIGCVVLLCLEMSPSGISHAMLLSFHLHIYTEASKLVMQYVAAVSGRGKEVDRVKEQLLQSNPVLEGTHYTYA